MKAGVCQGNSNINDTELYTEFCGKRLELCISIDHIFSNCSWIMKLQGISPKLILFIMSYFHNFCHSCCPSVLILPSNFLCKLYLRMFIYEKMHTFLCMVQWVLSNIYHNIKTTENTILYSLALFKVPP